MKKVKLVERPVGVPSAVEICKIITTFHKEGYDCPVPIAKELWGRIQVSGALPPDWWNRMLPFWSGNDVSN